MCRLNGFLCPKCHGEAAQDSTETEGGHLALFGDGGNKCSLTEVKFILGTEGRIGIKQVERVGAFV